MRMKKTTLDHPWLQLRLSRARLARLPNRMIGLPPRKRRLPIKKFRILNPTKRINIKKESMIHQSISQCQGWIQVGNLEIRDHLKSLVSMGSYLVVPSLMPTEMSKVSPRVRGNFQEKVCKLLAINFMTNNMNAGEPKKKRTILNGRTSQIMTQIEERASLE
jgi:hypothetical protein